MKLYLAQHGHAVSREQDPERPLSDQGEQDVHSMAARLGRAGVRVTRVWHSGKRRAEQTAGILAKKVLSGRNTECIKGLGPNDPVAEFATDADVWDEDTLVVGHLPFMSRLLSLLLVNDAGHELVRFSPGSVVCLEHDATDCWVISWLLRPELLSND